jgi:hypothetical protein
MHQALIPHPDSQPGSVDGVEVDVVHLYPRALVLRYRVTGHLDDLVLPPVGETVRADELWKSTCFEAFVTAAPGGPYFEFNFAPSAKWAAYSFTAYRTGMANAQGVAAPRFDIQRPDTMLYDLRVAFALDTLEGLPADAAWRLALSAVIAEKNGTISYWALAHPPGKPDFHHSDCFALELPAPEKA